MTIGEFGLKVFCLFYRWIERSDTANPQPATRNPQPATRNPQPATRNPKFTMRYFGLSSSGDNRHNFP